MKKLLLMVIGIVICSTVFYMFNTETIQKENNYSIEHTFSELYMGVLNLIDNDKYNNLRVSQFKNEQFLEIGKLKQEEQVKDRANNLYKKGLIVSKLNGIIYKNTETIENNKIGEALEAYLKKDYETIINTISSRNTSSTVDILLQELVQRMLREDLYSTTKID